jgi:predicted metalloprotease with PDZ domain
MANMVRVALLFSAFGLAAFSSADIQYSVIARHGEPLHVTITVPIQGQETVVQSPRWAPGAYRIANYARNILNLGATDSSGKPLDLKVVDDMTWSVANPPSGAVTFKYDVRAQEADNTIHYSGPATYLYVADRKNEKCKLAIDIPADWKIAIGLDPDGAAAHRYWAPTYDVLADTPVTTGDFILDTYMVDGKPHLIALRGAPKSQVDQAYLTKACEFISRMDDKLFHGLPYHRYVWHFAVNDRPDGAGGLEHLNGTEITLAKGLGPRAVGVLSHEYFHLWNVKRIRASVLGPFDYTKLPQTGALWWLEGVTDYYAHTLLRRNRWSDDKQYFGTLSENLRAQRAAPGRLTVSPYDSSYRVGDADAGRGNSNGFQVSYYNTGWLLGLCFDLDILARTHGKKSLDDALLGLWKECRDNQPGFPEDGIRTQLIAAGGPALGDLYDQIVMKPGDLPVEAELAKVGLQLVSRQEKTIETGFTAGGGFGAAGITVRTAQASTGLMVGDVVTSIGGVTLTGLSRQELAAAYQKGLATAAVGAPLAVSVMRNGNSLDRTITPTEGERTVQDVQTLPGATDEQHGLQTLWLSAKRR